MCCLTEKMSQSVKRALTRAIALGENWISNRSFALLSFQRQFSQIRSRADGFGRPVPWPLPVPLASPRLLFHCPWTYGIPPDFCFESLSCPDLPNGDLKYVLQSGSKQSERHPPRLLPEIFFFAVWSAQGLSGMRTDLPCSGTSHSRCKAPHRTNEAWRGDCK